MLEKDKASIYQHQLEAELKDTYGDNYTKEDIMEFLYGCYDCRRTGSYTLYSYKDKPKRSLFNRFNMLWTYPVFLLLVFPVKWILTGEWGAERNSKLGRAIEWLVKFD